MIKVIRLLHKLAELPKKGEEFTVRSGEAPLGSLLVEEVRVECRIGDEIVHVWGFG